MAFISHCCTWLLVNVWLFLIKLGVSKLFLFKACWHVIINNISAGHRTVMEKVVCELCERQHCPLEACESQCLVHTIKSLCGFSVVGERTTFALYCQCCLQGFLSEIAADWLRCLWGSSHLNVLLAITLLSLMTLTYRDNSDYNPQICAVFWVSKHHV